jgi:hypothetical protein
VTAARRILRDLRIDEFSLVDKGAQEPGFKPLLKRHKSADGAAVVEIEPAAFTALLETPQFAAAVQAAIAAAVQPTTHAQPQEIPMTTDPDRIKDLEAELATTKADLTKAQNVIAKAAEPKPVALYKAADGSEYFDTATAELAKRVDKAEANERDVALEKRVGEKFKHMRGSKPALKALLAKAEEIADEAVRAEVMQILAGADAAYAASQKSVGLDVHAVPTGAAAEITKRVEARMTAKSESREAATAWLVEHDNEFNALRSQAKAERAASRA